jgi:ribosomal protein L37AE/L43A
MSNLNKPPTSSEDEYFAREDAEKKRKAALELAQKMAEHEREAQKAAHFMHCPKCGSKLTTVKFKDLDIDKCFTCNGSWLDAGELETLAGKEPGFLGKIVAVFKHDKDGK